MFHIIFPFITYCLSTVRELIYKNPIQKKHDCSVDGVLGENLVPNLVMGNRRAGAWKKRGRGQEKRGQEAVAETWRNRENFTTFGYILQKKWDKLGEPLWKGAESGSKRYWEWVVHTPCPPLLSYSMHMCVWTLISEWHCCIIPNSRF